MKLIEPVLTDFKTIRLSEMTPQDQSCTLLSKGMAKALAVKSGKTSVHDVEKIYNHVRSKFIFFAVSSKTIKHRYLTLWPKNYDTAAEKKKIVENGRFVNYDVEFPMYEDLARLHSNPEGAHLTARMNLYKIHSEKHIRDLYEEVVEIPDQIIHVTSTGYIDPNPVATVIAEKKWYDVEITNFYHRACNATIPAISTAYAYMRSSHAGGYEKPKKRIDIVHSEMFSAHITIADDQPINIMIMSSYSDSYLRYSLRSSEDLYAIDQHGLKIIAFKSMTIPDSISIAEWKVSDPAFSFALDTFKALELIKTNVKNFISSFLQEVHLDYNYVKNNLIYGIQASSSLILKQIKKELKLSNEQITLSQQTLYENGYLSSGAIPYMSKKVIESDNIPVGQKVLFLGYGQGIIMSAMLLEKM